MEVGTQGPGGGQEYRRSREGYERRVWKGRNVGPREGKKVAILFCGIFHKILQKENDDGSAFNYVDGNSLS